MIDFVTPLECAGSVAGCEGSLRNEKMQEGEEFKYLGTVLSKHGNMKEKMERAVKGRQTLGSIKRLMRGRNLSMQVKGELDMK